jgi:hypothetical protein
MSDNDCANQQFPQSFLYTAICGMKMQFERESAARGNQLTSQPTTLLDWFHALHTTPYIVDTFDLGKKLLRFIEKKSS